ncbi:hypothetical protein B0E51_15605 [Rhodanobacter sp. C05]|nr:hypothetical protein B0E51_15605 [Rhodanobacter sp. C05]
MAQCEKIYERTETTRKFVEEKARATFGIVSFLAPLIGAGFVFLLTQSDKREATYTIALVLTTISGFLLLLAFISIARAVGVKEHMDLLLDSVLEKDQFRNYDAARYARGLLYCASWNGGMNAHVAQFVRGGHILISLSVLFAFAGSIPLGMTYAETARAEAHHHDDLAKSDPVADQVAFLHRDLAAMHADLQNLERQGAEKGDVGFTFSQCK